jgi:hypothetical protein
MVCAPFGYHTNIRVCLIYSDTRVPPKFMKIHNVTNNSLLWLLWISFHLLSFSLYRESRSWLRCQLINTGIMYKKSDNLCRNLKKYLVLICLKWFHFVYWAFFLGTESLLKEDGIMRQIIFETALVHFVGAWRYYRPQWPSIVLGSLLVQTAVL